MDTVLYNSGVGTVLCFGSIILAIIVMLIVAEHSNKNFNGNNLISTIFKNVIAIALLCVTTYISFNYFYSNDDNSKTVYSNNGFIKKTLTEENFIKTIHNKYNIQVTESSGYAGLYDVSIKDTKYINCSMNFVKISDSYVQLESMKCADGYHSFAKYTHNLGLA